MAREQFKDPNAHSCQDQMDMIIDKFQGNINKLIEEDESVAASE